MFIKRFALLTLAVFTAVALDSGHGVEPVNSVHDVVGNSTCELLYSDYLRVVENFTHCELKYAKPFRVCISCSEQFEIADAIYMNLTQEPMHEECRVKYFQSDRVQIIPTIQENMQTIWRKSSCHKCYLYNPSGLESGEVNYGTNVEKFLALYENFTNCVNLTSQDDMARLWTEDGNVSTKCSSCNSSYASLNSLYNYMYESDGGDICMDLVDRMNYTRRLWSLQLKCSHRSGDRDSMPVIIVSCVVACTPILFYVSLRATGKVGQKEIYKQKRLTSSQEASRDIDLMTGNFYSGAGDLGH